MTKQKMILYQLWQVSPASQNPFTGHHAICQKHSGVKVKKLLVFLNEKKGLHP